MAIYYRPTDRPLPFLLQRTRWHGDPARFVCGYLGCDARPFNPILDALPRVLHVKRASTGGQLTHDLIRVALRRTERPSAGGETMLSKLSEADVPARGTPVH